MCAGRDSNPRPSRGRVPLLLCPNQARLPAPNNKFLAFKLKSLPEDRTETLQCFFLIFLDLLDNLFLLLVFQFFAEFL